jgi:hypothetical protein
MMPYAEVKRDISMQIDHNRVRMDCSDIGRCDVGLKSHDRHGR